METDGYKNTTIGVVRVVVERVVMMPVFLFLLSFRGFVHELQIVWNLDKDQTMELSVKIEM